jgi:deoxyribodipyrimidine photo-lyase
VAEEVLPRLAAQVGAGAVYCYGEVTREEQRVEGAVAAALDRQGARLVTSWGGTLYHRDDLPFQLKDLPPSYGEPAHDP